MPKRLPLAVLLFVSLAALPGLPLGAQPAPAPLAPSPSPQAATPPPPKDSADPIERIKDEGLNRSQVMQTLSYLTDVIGPRLTGSPGMKRANEWTRNRMAAWGLQNARLEPWGPFGRGWTLKRFSAQVIEPQTIPLIAYPKAWSPGTNGTLVGSVVYVDATDEAGLAGFKGRLKGAIVLTSPVREVRARFEPLASRWTEQELAELAEPPRVGRPRARRPRAARPPLTPEQRAAFAFSARKAQFLRDEGAALLVDSSRGDGGTLFVQSASVGQPPDTPRERRVAAWDRSAPKVIPQMVVAVEDYNRLARMLRQGEKLKMAVDLQVAFHDDDKGMAFNTVAEIPGTDKRDEIVMLGGHLDSWHSSTGATDNAAGVAVCMEAVRILQALRLQPRRTIRVALWSGEEQGLYGSRAYVARHFGTMTEGEAPALVAKPDYDKFCAYFNLDNGTGRIRGVWGQGNEAVLPIFREWLAPFADLGASTVTLRNTGGTDHLPFDAIGLPGFQFIQDEIEYGTRTHHSNQDNYDRLQADDMKQASVIMAAFVYNAAMREERLPRKPVSAGPPPAAPPAAR